MLVAALGMTAVRLRMEQRLPKRSVLVVIAKERRQDGRAFQPNGIEGVRIEAQDLQNRGSHLSGLHKAVDDAGLNIGFDTSSITFVSSCAKPPCSDCFFRFPV